MVREVIGGLSNPYSDLVDDKFCKELLGTGELELRREYALKIISRELQRFYGKEVVVLIDEYDSPMHSAIEHGYSSSVRSVILSIATNSRYSRPTLSLLQYSVRC